MRMRFMTAGIVLAGLTFADSSLMAESVIVPVGGRPLPGGFGGNRPGAGAGGGAPAPGLRPGRLPDGSVVPIAPPHPSGAAVLELLEDGAARMARGLNVGDEAARTTTRAGAWGEDCYSGVTCLKVAGYQRWREQIPGWNFPVVAKPKAGEYRYLRFAWKKPDHSGIMIQLCVSGQDFGRYFAGQNLAGFFPALQIDPVVPREWTIVTRDLLADFGNVPFNLTGLAFTSVQGTAMFDHIYLGRTIEDLDKITNAARTWAAKTESLGTSQLDKHWKNLANEDAAIRLPSLWALGACGESSRPFIKSRIQLPESGKMERRITKAIADLDSPRYAIRERAFKELAQIGISAQSKLDSALMPGISQEWRTRLEKLIAKCKAEDTPYTAEQSLLLRSIHVLEASNSQTILESLANAQLEAGLSEEAKAALARIGKRKQ